jgi:hypothetical protein
MGWWVDRLMTNWRWPSHIATSGNTFLKELKVCVLVYWFAVAFAWWGADLCLHNSTWALLGISNYWWRASPLKYILFEATNPKNLNPKPCGASLLGNLIWEFVILTKHFAYKPQGLINRTQNGTFLLAKMLNFVSFGFTLRSLFCAHF